MDPADAQLAYRTAEKAIVDYLADMEFPARATDIMLSTRSQDIHWTTREDLGSGPQSSSPPSIDEWIDKACPGLSSREYAKLKILSGEYLTLEGSMANQDRSELEELDRRFAASVKCVSARFGQHRDAMTLKDLE